MKEAPRPPGQRPQHPTPPEAFVGWGGRRTKAGSWWVGGWWSTKPTKPTKPTVVGWWVYFGVLIYNRDLCYTVSLIRPKRFLWLI